MTERTPASTTLPTVDEINAMYKTRSLIRSQMKMESDSSTSVNSTEVKEDILLQLLSSRIIGNFVLIWLDPNIDTNDEDIEYSIAQLRCVVGDLKTFTDADECTDFLTDIVNEKAFMIISGNIGHQILSSIQDISQLHSIYIFCEHQAKYEEWVKEYKKVKGVFNQIESICNALKQDVRQSDIDMVPISIVSIPSTINPDELDPSFMYSQLLKETILNIEFDEEAKTKFANFCRANDPDNKTQLNKIDEFQHEYEQHSPIWWYTKEPFIYSTLNKALRTQDTTIIIMIGFFLKDLHRDIEKLHQAVQETSTIVVYRGQGMLNADFEKMKNSKGALLSFNSFLSTSIDWEVANMFASSSAGDLNLTGVLFKMEIHPSVSKAPFALLDNVSHHSDDEKEILFSMHTVFRIKEIEQIDTRLWQVSLTLTSDNDQQLKDLTEYISNELEANSGWHRLGCLMLKMGVLEKAEQIFNSIIETTSVTTDLQLTTKQVSVYHNLSVTQVMMGKYSAALSYFKKTLEILQKSLPQNHPVLARTNNNIGMIYQSMGDYSTALSYYQRILEIQQKSLPHNHPELAMTNNNIGMIYQSMGEYSTALSYLKKTLEIEEKSLLHNHPHLARTNNNIGMIYQSMGEYSTALSYYQKTLEIQQKSLPHNHPELAITNGNIGLIYKSMGEYSTALSYYQKTLEIQQISLSHNHRDLATTNNNIGIIHKSMGEYSTALSYCQKALEIQQKSLPHNHQDLATTNDNIGMIYESMGKYSAAILYHQKALEIEEKSLPPNHPHLARTNNNIGMIYQSMGEYSTALSYYQKALEIQQISLPHNHRDLARTNNNIGMIHHSMGEYSTALSYCQKALEIQEKSPQHNHPDLATTNNNIGMIYQSMGEYSTALSYYQKALEIQQISLPHNHRDLARTNNNIGMIHHSMGEYSTALSYLKKTLEIEEKTLLHNHPHLATTNNNIGMIYQSMGEYSTALSYYQKALEIQHKSFPHNHPDLATTNSNIGALYHQIGDHRTALSYLEKALEVIGKSGSPNSPILIQIYSGNAVILYALGRRAEAIGNAERAVQVARRVFGLNHLKTITIQNFFDKFQ